MKAFHAKLFWITTCLFLFVINYTQAQPFQVFVQEDSSFSNMPALHSGAVCSYQNKIIFLGGRTNGLHGFHPPLAFPTGGRNTYLLIYDPLVNTFSGIDLTSLNDSLFEQLSSSNFQYVLSGDYLYVLGGYGWNNQQNDFKTYDGLVRIYLPSLLDSINSQGSIMPSISVVHDPLFKVCGGHLRKTGNDFYLVFGHSFDGIYNRTDTSGFFVQHYTNRVHRFSLGGPSGMSVQNHVQWYDSLNFHRRDYNLNTQIFPDGTTGFVAFSGVFRRGVNLPYYTPVEIHGGNCTEIPFQQQFAHYHSATAALYDSLHSTQYNLFFGGMAAYYKRNNQIRYDSLVPFVKSVSMLSRDASGAYQEYLMNDTLPTYLGTNAVFLPLQGLPLSADEVIRLDLLPPGVQQIGWMIGGIESPDANISESDPSISFASNRVFRVYINRQLTALQQPQEQGPELKWQNPCSRQWDFTISHSPAGTARLFMSNLNGTTVLSRVLSLKQGFNRFTENISDLPAGMYVFTLSIGKFQLNGKVFVLSE